MIFFATTLVRYKKILEVENQTSSVEHFCIKSGKELILPLNLENYPSQLICDEQIKIGPTAKLLASKCHPPAQG